MKIFQNQSVGAGERMYSQESAVKNTGFRDQSESSLSGLSFEVENPYLQSKESPLKNKETNIPVIPR